MEAARSPRVQGLRAGADGAPPRVLIVDDHFPMAEMLAEGLVERGYVAVPVGSGREAERKLIAEPFDALVTDLRMPDLDGTALLAISRALAPERPVLVMTAYSAVDSALEALRRGARHYLTKPFKLDELALFLERALDEARVRLEVSALKRAKDELVEVPESLRGTRESSMSLGGPIVSLREVQRRYVTWAYDQLGGRALLTADKLGIDVNTLRGWLVQEPEGGAEEY